MMMLDLIVFLEQAHAVTLAIWIVLIIALISAVIVYRLDKEKHRE
jgi:uncharacterized membrane protein YhfC